MALKSHSTGGWPGTAERGSVGEDILVTTASVAAELRLGFWRDMVCQTIAGVEAKGLSSRRAYAGSIRRRAIPLEDRHFDFLQVKADPQWVSRTRELIQLQTEETWLLMIQDFGTCTVRQGAQESTLAVGDIAFLDTSRPYEVMFPQAFGQSILRVPTVLFKEMIPTRRDMAGLALAGADPLTAIARHNLLLLERYAQTIGAGLLPGVAERALDHLGFAMRTHLDGNTMRRNGDMSAQHFARARLYIDDHLHEASLSVGRIARSIGLSSGHLHEVFRKSTGATVGDYIRGQRLIRCRRDLADPSLWRESITTIAFRWGFSEASSFSRAFRTAFETSPRLYRQAQKRQRTQ